MLKFAWPISPGATTPKGQQTNPFDSPIHTLQHSKSSSGEATPMALTPAAAGIQPLAFPTTQLSIDPPQFNLMAPPPSKLTPTQDLSPSKSSVAAPRGQLHVKLIQARGLNVKSAQSRPYVVVVYEQNEFISREPTHEDEKEVRGVPAPLSRQNSSSAMTALGGIQMVLDKLKPPSNTTSTPTTVSSSAGSEGVSSRSSSGSSGGSKVIPKGINDGARPVWKHQVAFDVTSEHSILSLNIYDRKYEGVEGYLGTVEIKPALVHDRVVDIWHPLESKAPGEHKVTGELRVQIKYEQTASKRSLTPKDFEILKLIGKGTFGRVFQVRKKDTKRIYAMKVLSKKEIVAKKEVAHTIGERKILQRSLESPFLVGLKFSFQTESELFLVTDFKSGGELFWHLQRETRFTEERSRFYIAELTLALEHLHKHDIVYRDLKPENILLDATGHVALCDFGLSKPDLASNQLTNTFCGTTEYLAPEILLDDLGYSKMVDFWSLGVLLFEMLCGWSPFYNEDTQVMYRNICYGKIKFPRNTVSEDGKQFVKGLLNRVPMNRLGSKGDAAELKAHAFFSSIDWEALSRKEVTPPFKPDVESDECTNNFDPEFTSADLKEVGVDYWDDEFDDVPAQSTNETGGQVRVYNGPAGSERMLGSSVSAPNGAIAIVGTSAGGSDANTPMGSFRNENHVPIPNAISTAAASKKIKRPSTPISSSVQENFFGFSYTASESVDGWGSGVLGRRMKEEEERDRMLQREEAVVDDEITIVQGMNNLDFAQ